MSQDQPATYIVEGMTCEHCVASVNEEVADVDGVSNVVIDLATGRLEVTGDGFSDAEISRKVEAAGYRIAGRI